MYVFKVLSSLFQVYDTELLYTRYNRDSTLSSFVHIRNDQKYLLSCVPPASSMLYVIAIAVEFRTHNTQILAPNT